MSNVCFVKLLKALNIKKKNRVLKFALYTHQYLLTLIKLKNTGSILFFKFRSILDILLSFISF